MTTAKDYSNDVENEWCPGCGNFGILKAIKKALSDLDKKPHEVLMCSGIGQAGKLPHYLKCNIFNGLHGRAIPVATAAKTANHDLTVIAVGGDGDMYGEGGNHFIHNIRRNPDITLIAHDNQIYGLTKGQASPTSDIGMKTKLQPHGVVNTPFNPLSVAIALDCSFVSRGFAGDVEHLSKIIGQAIDHKGFSLVDILQPCVTFNRLNTFKWYRERVYKLDETDHDPYNRTKAFEKALEWGERIPTGIFYRTDDKETFEDMRGLASTPLAYLDENIDISTLVKEFI
ncbi:pyruvate ferredoxin/flavodoxin oxidoreductase, beta subunit [Methanosalsum zhilinae DSM 4017]|uniref:Pyruvate ferredoxin/flavodoxin oxidoreductase, beta subunit n=1 Tax=Methanosalsum zhilinae (strain DSM 4017 / NBRC 107636 / OCM 62 / WeN5) TaxID=679901 RepID=F7XN12_METZD|nr:thiamine pyrophosphate-dependent enzyme [Methanosalsum zhilinae]AEH61121.1 pyruvate ferredoxin/flavodoxin oxidoreductase, beta subunit [Methanosalsum zhilinae DSM 4017]